MGAEEGNLKYMEGESCEARNNDRYIIVDNKHLYLLGSSINSFGVKATTLVPINQPEVKASINNYFNLLWRESPNLYIQSISKYWRILL